MLLLVACTKQKPSAATVPAYCQQFLDKYFDAWKSKDATLQALSFYLSPAERSQFPDNSLELWRQSKNKLVADNFERVTSEFGDFKDYTVLIVKTKTVSEQNQPGANMMRSGVHTDLVCKAKFSEKRNARVGLHLIKETESSQYVVAAWNFQVAP